MPFNATLTGGQTTQVRQTNQAFEHYLLVNPNDVVWQAEINDTKSAENYAEFEWANTQSGASANVIAGQVVYITATKTVFTNPIYRGRVRKVPGASTFYINENGTDIDNTMYLTVIDDFDIMERLQRLAADKTRYKDWDITYQELPPIIDGLQSVYADFSGSATVSWDFAPTATATESGAAISSWLWDIGDGSFTAGTSASQNITAQFPGAATNEHRWVHLTVTDDNGIALTFHFEVYTVNKQTSTAVKLDTGQLQITSSLEDGWNATITAWEGMAVTEVWDQTRVAIAGIDHYDSTQTPVVSNILMVGRLRTEEARAQSDELAGAVSEVNFTVEGFTAQLARLPAPALSILDSAAPSIWGEMIDPTPYRSVIYFLAYHTTYASLSSISTDDLSSYVLGDFTLGETTGLESVNQQLDSANAIAAFAPSGETTCRRKASYQSDADRAGLTTVFDFTTADIVPETAIPFEYGETVGEIEAGAVVYNTSLDDIDFRYIGRAPASSFGSGHETAQLNGQVLVANQTDANARLELVQRTADHLAYINPKENMNVGLMDGFWFIIPTLHQRWTFTLAATDTERGRVYTTGDYWQLTSIAYSLDNDLGTRELSATFEAETQGGNAGVAVTLVPDINLLDFSLPPLSPYDTFPDDPLTNFPIDDPTVDPYLSGGMADVLEPQPNNQDSPINCEVMNIDMFQSLSRATTRSTVFGETYTIRVEGMANTTGGWTEHFLFDTAAGAAPDTTYDQGGWVIDNLGESWSALFSSGTGWEDVDILDAPGDARREIAISRTFSTTTITGVSILLSMTSGGSPLSRAWLASVAGTLVFTSASTGADITISGSANEVATKVLLFLIADQELTIPALTGDIVLKSCTLTGTGAKPPEFSAASDPQKLDAFYEWQDAATAALQGAGLGFLINNNKPGTIGPFSAANDYTFTFTGTGGPLSFKFQRSDYSVISRNILKVTVCGSNMGTTP